MRSPQCLPGPADKPHLRQPRSPVVLDLRLSSCVTMCRGLALSEPPWLLCALELRRLTWRGHCRPGGVAGGEGPVQGLAHKERPASELGFVHSFPHLTKSGDHLRGPAPARRAEGTTADMHSSNLQFYNLTGTPFNKSMADLFSAARLWVLGRCGPAHREAWF